MLSGAWGLGRREGGRGGGAGVLWGAVGSWGASLARMREKNIAFQFQNLKMQPQAF